jgi:hypothetical protein
MPRGKAWLVEVAQHDPATFCALVGKILPKQIEQSIDLNIDWRAQLEAARRRVEAAKERRGEDKKAA